MEQLDAIMQIIAKEWFNKTIAKPMAWKKVEIKELRHYTHLTSLEKTGFVTYSSPMPRSEALCLKLSVL